jgi:hypothetical protein
MIVLGFEILNSFAASPHVFQLPPLNDHVLAGTPFTYGLLLGAGSLGGVSGGLLLGLLRLPLSKLLMYMSYCILCIGLCLISLSLSETLWVSMLVLFLLNIATAFLMVCETTFIQTNTTQRTRGQVMGFFMMAHIGLIPFGSVLLYGTVGDFVGGLRVFGVAGSLFICAFLLSRLMMLRQVETYENQGI